MTAWTPADLDAISRNADLYVSSFRNDGVTYGPPTRTWALVVDGQVYVRAANGPTSSWYRAAITQGAGRVRVEDRDYEVTYREAPVDVADAIDAAYEDEYPRQLGGADHAGRGSKVGHRGHQTALMTSRSTNDATTAPARP